jgi:hypothetical protein
MPALLCRWSVLELESVARRFPSCPPVLDCFVGIDDNIMLLLAFFGLLYAFASASASDDQFPLGSYADWPAVAGGSIIRLCPGSHEDDILQFIRITTDPSTPYLQVRCLVNILCNRTL